MKLKGYYVSLDDNRQCDRCGEEVSIQCFRGNLRGWEEVSSPHFKVETNLEFLKKLRRWCYRCNKPMEIKYRIQNS
jgi:ribosomal protein S27AE